MDDDPVVHLRLKARRLSPSEGFTNSINLFINTVQKNSTTGHQTLTSSNLFDFNLHSLNPNHIHHLLHNQLLDFPWLCEYLASDISVAATDIGFGHNGFVITILVEIITTSTLSSSSSSSKAVLMKLVLRGRLDETDLKRLKIETEPCSICLEKLSGSNLSVPTRMPCSHVFHDGCLFDWLYRNNTCPLCRTVLYD